ncbi:MAG: zf-TFIIB domain-containing protein [Proteobacteria bacterium]|nr:zf-TFIIB domain-containing protein [Pseudomonadota bacterium]
MANCNNCSAPLPPHSNICDHCGSKNDTDLKGIHQFTIHEPDSARTCPRCKISLQTIDLKVEGKFLIERCEQCLGLFFDTGELEALLKASVTHVYHIDRQKIDGLNQTSPSKDYPTTYIPCPVCGSIMNRVNFGTRSGVIIDRCPEHGMWLDGGELRHLLEWVKAGGELLSKQKNEQLKKEKARQNGKSRNIRPSMGATPSVTFDQYGSILNNQAPDIFTILVRVMRWLAS